MVIHVPYISVECTGANLFENSATRDRIELQDRNHLSTFTNDLLMWSPNPSISNTYSELYTYNHREPTIGQNTSPPDSVEGTIVLELPNDIRLSTSADSGYDENYLPYDRYYDSGSLTGPTTYSHPIASTYGYPHRHTNHVVSCILCSLESYRKFQDRMGWPHYLEYPEYENFTMQFNDATSTTSRKIYPHLTTDANNKAGGFDASRSFITKIAQHQYYRAAERIVLAKKQPRLYATGVMSRIGHQLQRHLIRLVGR